MLTAVYKARIMMEDTNELVKQKPVDIDVDNDNFKTIIPSFIGDGYKRNSDLTE